MSEEHVAGHADGETRPEQPFPSGETNMSHSPAHLEAHLIKHGSFRRPGDVHVHFLGTATLSVSNGVTTREGNLFGIEAPPFTLPLGSPLVGAPAECVVVRAP
jgi:hypothetical protein